MNEKLLVGLIALIVIGFVLDRDHSSQHSTPPTPAPTTAGTPR